MSELYKIVRYNPPDDTPLSGGIIGANWYHGFEQAKKAFHETVKEKFDGMSEKCDELIDSYCKKYYPDGAPENFDQLKQSIREYIADPEAFEKDYEKYEDIDFEDERICFGLGYDLLPDGLVPFLYMKVTDEAKWEFPEGSISSLLLRELKDPESELYISLTAGEHWGLEIVFSLMTDEDKDEYPWDR